uniref:MLX interacting protein n=1 Tax=Cyprinus carpio TaxID=7962 RepID=A0A8C1KUX2_CYPCA
MATREPRLMVKQEQDDDSDAEEPTVSFRRADQQIIHSGHFMVSSPHTEHPPKKGYDFDTVNKQTCQTYRFGKTSTSHFSIDASLTKLFECMTLAYSGRLVSPKWKNFKGLKLLWRDKIRLNNAIWRAWYMQYVEKRQNPVCHFVTPLDGNMDSGVHRPTEAIATEGKYWKRRIEIVIREYHKWRTYFKKRLQKHKDEDLSSLLRVAEEQFSLFGEVCPDTCRVLLYQDEDVSAGGRRRSRRSHDSPVPMEMDLLFDMDVLMSEFSDTLFSTLASHQPVAWPNPREIAHAGNADMIQPGLIPLQPNLDFMDTFEPLQGTDQATLGLRLGLKLPQLYPTRRDPYSQQVQVRFSPIPLVFIVLNGGFLRKLLFSFSVAHDRRVSGQGSPLGAEQVPSPQSPLNPCAGKNEGSQSRRVNHISAEQKRRFTINACFKTLCNLVPTLRPQSNISNAATLQKTVDYISKLQLERQQMQEETKRLREEIEELNASISLCQEQLPDTGVPVARHRFDHMKEKFDDYVKNRTLQNWKFWIFSVIIHPLFESFNGTVSTTNSTELCETTMQWLDRYCALPVLRPMVLRTLRQLCTSTSILTDPSLLPEEAKKAALNPKKHSSGS